MWNRGRIWSFLVVAAIAGCAGEDANEWSAALGSGDAAGGRDGAGGTGGNDGGGPDVPCDVVVRGGPKVCLDCQGSQPSTRLTAEGTPGGGTYAWAVVAGAERIALSARGPLAFARGTAPSVAEQDVTVRVTYEVSGTTCSASVELTVVKPTSLGVLSDATYVVAGGAFNPPLPPDVARAMGEVPAKVARDPQLVGALRVRQYDVLDQFGNRWPCNGRLQEKLKPHLPGMRVGGTTVTGGVVDQPDRLYYIDRPTKGPKKNPMPNFPQRTVQTITVSRCPVAQFAITFNANSVLVQ